MATATCTEHGRRANQLRKEFTLAAAPARATVRFSALGFFELRCNGRRVGADRLAPGRTNLRTGRAYYLTYDLTPHLRAGANVLAVTLGNGWFSTDGFQPGAYPHPPQLLLEATGVFPPAATPAVLAVSDETWRSATGPITSDSVYQGEAHDLRLRTGGWDAPGFAGAALWAPAEPASGVVDRLGWHGGRGGGLRVEAGPRPPPPPKGCD